MKSHCRFAVTFIVCAFAGVLSLPGTSFGVQKMLVGATSASSSHYGYFVAASQVINKNVPGIEASVVETGATADNLRRFSRRQIDIGMITTNTQSEAYYGQALYAKNPVKTKILWVMSSRPRTWSCGRTPTSRGLPISTVSGLMPGSRDRQRNRLPTRY